MPIQRIPLAEPITTRAGDVLGDDDIARDSELTNCVVETVAGNVSKRVVITRPALSYLLTIQGGCGGEA